MEKTFIFAGFGGQGMLLIGKFVAMACMLDGKHVSWLPSYGPEMRGGTANCSVIVSDDPVASPLVDKADVIVAMNRPSLDKFEEHVKPGGVLVYSTFTVLARENEDVVRGFLRTHPEFSPEAFSLPLPGADASDGMFTFWPQEHGTDGFFVCKLRRHE